MHRQRCAIVGTAPSWIKCPWDDPALHIVSLNDAYMNGIPRANEWYELHPIDKMWWRDPAVKIIDERQVPKGHYIRPRGHLEWLQQQAKTIPVWLQAEPPDGWPPNAQRFPREEMEAKYGPYWASGPAWMLMHLYDRGFREFQIYGIHLATEHEYREQRPNWEHLLGRLLGVQVKETKRDGRWIYEGAEVTVIMPEEVPILRHGWKYAYDPKPVRLPNEYEVELQAVRQEKAALVRKLVHWPKGEDKAAALARLTRLEVIELDCQMQLQKRMGGGTLTATVFKAA